MITGPGSTVWTAYAVRRALADGRVDARRLRRSALRIRALAQP
jgi:hypothetical protein